jgi:twinkle protein
VETSELLFKGPCDDCGSSDACAHYDDGHTHCFSCGHHGASDGEAPTKRSKKMSANMLQGEYRPLSKRGINEETCRKFGYRVALFKDQTVQVADYYNPEGTEVVAQKVRFANKDFTILGDMKQAGLYGQHLWGAGKMVVVTEGEIDALSVSQLQNNKWPVVSVPNGADGAVKSIKKNLEWLSQFETVVLMLDNDDPGRKAAQACATLFPPGKCKIARLPLKDANEVLQAGRGGEIISAMWNAKPYRPDGIVKLSDIREEMKKKIELGLPWVFPELTKLTYGRRYGEVYAVGAGTGVGKTDFLTQQIGFDINELKEKVALFFFEQQPGETGKRIAGKIAHKRFHVPDGGWTQEQLDATVDALVEDDRLFLYDHFGTTEWDIIKQNIRFLAVSEGVRIFYLDHLTAFAAGAEDERKALENIMAEIGSLVKELDIMLMLVSHLSTPEGKPHEEGGRVMIRHFKGSRAIGFWCHFMFGMERDQQAEDDRLKQITTFRVLKDRYTGQATGSTFLLGYEVEKGLLFETTDDFQEEKTDDDDLPF